MVHLRYLVNGNIDDGSYDGKVHHLTVMAKNLAGYKNLVKMTSKSHLEGYRVRNRSKRPAVNKDILSRHRNGLIVLSGCLAGEIPQALLSGRYDVARQVAKWYQDVFKDDFYLEMMDHGLVKDSIVNPGIVQLGKDLGIKVVVTNDSHFTNESDCTAHDALLCIQVCHPLLLSSDFPLCPPQMLSVSKPTLSPSFYTSSNTPTTTDW